MYYTDENPISGGYDVFYNGVIIGWNVTYEGAFAIMQEHSADRRRTA